MGTEQKWIDLIYEGVNSEDTEKAKRLIDQAIEHGVDPNSVEGSNSPLHWAAFGKRIEIVQHLINCGATPNAEVNHDDNSLHITAQNGSVEIMKLLLTAPHDLVLNSFDKLLGHTPLSWAATEDHIEVIRVLIDAGVDLNACCDELIGDSAIRRAVENGNIEMVQLLLAHGADPAIPGWMQLTAIHKAQMRHDDIGKKMLLAMRQESSLSEDEWNNLLLTNQQLKPSTRSISPEDGAWLENMGDKMKDMDIALGMDRPDED